MRTNPELMKKREKQIGKVHFCQRMLRRKKCSDTIKNLRTKEKNNLLHYSKLSTSSIDIVNF